MTDSKEPHVTSRDPLMADETTEQLLEQLRLDNVEFRAELDVIRRKTAKFALFEERQTMLERKSNELTRDVTMLLESAADDNS